MSPFSRRAFVALFVAAFAVTAGFVPAQDEQAAPAQEELELTDLEWIAPTDARLEVRGLAFWAQQPGVWRRLPTEDDDKYPDDVRGLSGNMSGARIRFRSDTTALAVRVTYPSLPGMRNMHAFGQAGIDVYLDGGYRSSLAPRKEKTVEAFLFKGIEARSREVEIYLPLYLGVESLEVGLPKEVAIEPAAPYMNAKPVVFYGTSITQGGCASRPGLSYQAMLERRLNLDFINLGFSGAGRAQPEVVPHLAAIDAALFVVDMGPNNPTPESARESVERLLTGLREAHPTMPILVVTPIYMAYELPGSNRPGNLEEMREAIREIVRRRVAEGDEHLTMVEGFSLVGPERGDGLVDGVHPNDLGFHWMADGLEAPIRALLAAAE